MPTNLRFCTKNPLRTQEFAHRFCGRPKKNGTLPVVVGIGSVGPRLRRDEMNGLDTSRIQQVIDQPIFVVGAPRSGTTWLQRMLIAHPKMCGGQESNFFSVFGDMMNSFHWGADSSRCIGLACYWTEERLKQRVVELWHETMSELVKSHPEAEYLVEKTPNHAMHMDFMSQLLPEARFIHVIRDSRAVVASLLAASNQEWGSGWAPNNARDAAVLWWRHVSEAKRSGLLLNKARYIEMRYEDLKENVLYELERMFKFVGVDCSDHELEKIIADHDFNKQKEKRGTSFASVGATVDSSRVLEPIGFFRNGESDGWKRDLSFVQKLVVWRFTRRMMWACGYGWNGRS